MWGVANNKAAAPAESVLKDLLRKCRMLNFTPLAYFSNLNERSVTSAVILNDQDDEFAYLIDKSLIYRALFKMPITL